MVAFEPAPTHVAAHARWVLSDPERVAVRWKADGAWHEATRADLIAAAGRVSAALTGSEIRAGDRIGIVGPSTKEWLTVALGAHAIGAVTVGGYPTSSSAQLRHVFGHSGCRAVFAGTATAARRVLEVADQLPDLRAVVVFDTDGLDETELDGVVPFTNWVRSAPLSATDAIALFTRRATAIDPDAPCTIVYTSGTTGDPRGALHTFASIGQVTHAVAVPMGYRPDDEYIVHLPLNHLAEQTYSVVLGGQVGWTLNFCESGLTLADDMVDVRPTVMFGVPRVFEKVREAIARRPDPGPDPLGPFGMSRLRLAVCGGAPLAADLVSFFAGLGLPMYNTFGMSEAGAIAASWQRPPRPDTCGQPFPGVEIRLDDDGECLVRSRGVMREYFRDPDATAAALTADGFLRTGDIARWTADGDLQLVDRKKDIIITAGGKNISPSSIEHALAAQPSIANAVVVGNDRRHLVALLVLDPSAAAKQAGASSADMAELLANPLIAKSVDSEVEAVNATLSRPEQIKRWAFLPRPLSPGDPEVTPTMKVRRRQFEARWAELIESLYA